MAKALVKAYADDDAVRNQGLEWDTHFGGSGRHDFMNGRNVDLSFRRRNCDSIGGRQVKMIVVAESLWSAGGRSLTAINGIADSPGLAC